MAKPAQPQFNQKFPTYFNSLDLVSLIVEEPNCSRKEKMVKPPDGETPSAAFLSGLKSKVGLALAKAAALRIVLNLDGAPIASKSHTHPSHSQTSRLLTSSLSLGLPVPRPTQCVRGA